ncbi:MAG TPA: patatin-like phospholipase family protein [Atribacterota bacterium]|nr:patatin-like phospholipase family protein [Atribacterota bacterium]
MNIPERIVWPPALRVRYLLYDLLGEKGVTILATKHFKIGLALGGGGARGLAHVGVIQFLETEGIPIDIIAGTSVGSVIGAFYALYKDSRKLRITAVELSKKMNQYHKYFDFNQFQTEQGKKSLPWGRLTEFIKKGYFLHTELRKTCLNDGVIMENIFKDIFGEYNFQETKIPFTAVAADLISGKEVILGKGRLMEAIMASCAIPGIFPPVQYHNQLLVDGGITDNVPIEVARKMGADFIISSNITRKLKRKKNFKNAIDILVRSEEITSKQLRRIQLETSDFVISPEIHHIDWWNFSKPEQCIKIGEEAAKKVKTELQKKLRKKQGKTKWKKLLFKV